MSFSEETWRRHLKPTFGGSLDVSLSASRPIGDCIFLVQPSEDPVSDEQPTDSHNLTVGTRMAIFALSIISKSDVSDPDQNISRFDFEEAVVATLPKLATELQWPLLRYSLIIAEIIADQPSFLEETSSPIKHTILQHLLSDLEALRYVTVRDVTTKSLLSTDTGDRTVNFSNSTLLGFSREVAKTPITAEVYYHARALRSLVSLLRHKAVASKVGVTWVDALGIGKAKSGEHVLRDAAILSGLRDDAFTTAPSIVQLRNRIVSDLSGVSGEDAIEKGTVLSLSLNFAVTWR